MLVRPMLMEIAPFPATVEKVFEFIYIGGSQAVKNNLVIERVSDNAQVYNITQNTYLFKHTVPVNALVNGIEYRAQIRVGDSIGNWSQFSDWIIFKVLSNPIITVDNIDYANGSKIYNQNFIFSATYSQAENEPLNSYHFMLYDGNKNPLVEYPEKYPDPLTPNVMSQQIDSLENGLNYHIEVITTSVYGAIGTTGLIKFTPQFVTPKVSFILFSENMREEGSIKVSANIIQLIGYMYDQYGQPIDGVQYIDGTWVDLTRPDYEHIEYAEGFDTRTSDFAIKLWCKDMPDGLFLTINNKEGGKMELFKEVDRLHLYKWNRFLTIKNHFVSKPFTVAAGQVMMIFLSSLGNQITIKAIPM